MISALVVCNNILQRSFKEKIEVTPMKLQKLLYFTYREYLQETDKSLFSEPFLAWKYGPVLQSVYDEFKAFHANPITKFAKDANGNVMLIDESRSHRLSSIINRVWEQNKSYTGIDLSFKTHQPGTAWDRAIKDHRYVLDDEDIKVERT